MNISQWPSQGEAIGQLPTALKVIAHGFFEMVTLPNAEKSQ